MTDARVLWKTGTNFTGKSVSGSELGLGSGRNDFRPMELLAIGLAGCTAMDVISILEKKRQDVTAFEVTVHAHRAEDHPKVFTRASIEYQVTGHAVEEEAVLRSIELSATRYCPAHAMFEKVFPIDLEYSIYEDRGDGERERIAGGSFVPSEQVENG
jgi:putative redox protein